MNLLRGCVWALLAFFWGAAQALATGVYEIPQGRLDGLALGSHLEFFLDQDRSRSFETVSSPSFQEFKPALVDTLGFGNFPGTIWFHAKVVQHSSEHLPIVLDLANPIKKATLYFRQGQDQTFTRSATGLAYVTDAPFQLPSRASTWELDLAKDQETEIYLQIESDLVVILSLRLYDYRSFYLKERLFQSFGGLFMGVVLAMLCFNFYLFLKSKELSYLYYVISLSFMHFAIFGASLYGNNFLIGRFSFADGRYLVLCRAIGSTALIAFARSILVRSEDKRLDLTYKVLIGLCSLLGLGWFFVSNLALLNARINLVLLTSMLITVPYALFLTRQNQRSALLFLISIFPLILVGGGSILIDVLRLDGVAPYRALALSASAVFQVMALALAVADKVAAIQKQHIQEEREHRQEIQALNSSLELKVEEQTRDIRSMLEHTKIGLLSLGPDLRVHRDYSRYLETILETKDLANRGIFEILFLRTHLGADALSKIRCALEYSIGEEQMFFEANASNLPKQLELTLGEKGVKYIDIDWSAILDKQGFVERVLLGVRDMSEHRRLQEEATRSRRSLQFIGELLENGSESYRSTERSCLDICNELESYVLDPRFHPKRHALYVRLHTLKSQARLQRFLALTDELHQLEDLMSEPLDQSQNKLPQLLERVHATRRVLDHYSQALASVERIRERESSAAQGTCLKAMLESLAPSVNRLAQDLHKGGCVLQLEIPEKLELPAQTLKAFHSAFLHMMRNSIDHGLETPVERNQAGKPLLGHIFISWESSGRLVYRDDGRGLNLKALKARAKEQQLISPSTTELVELIFSPGFSTKPVVDQISGRGIGMDAVRSIMREQGGDVWVETKGLASEAGFLPFQVVFQLPIEQLKSA